MPHGSFRELGGTLFWDAYNKVPITSGTTLGSPIFGNSHIEALYKLFFQTKLQSPTPPATKPKRP